MVGVVGLRGMVGTVRWMGVVAEEKNGKYSVCLLYMLDWLVRFNGSVEHHDLMYRISEDAGTNAVCAPVPLTVVKGIWCRAQRID